jgi:hypothetical protein
LHNDPPRIPHPRTKGGAQYRLYFFNGGNHIEKSHEFEAKDDAEAVRVSEGWREGRKMELWQGGRIVKRWG